MDSSLESQKKGKPASHRYNRLSLLPSGPGEVWQELVVPICRITKVLVLAMVRKEQELYSACCNTYSDVA
jgi:hypothetical protein